MITITKSHDIMRVGVLLWRLNGGQVEVLTITPLTSYMTYAFYETPFPDEEAISRMNDLERTTFSNMTPELFKALSLSHKERYPSADLIVDKLRWGLKQRVDRVNKMIELCPIQKPYYSFPKGGNEDDETLEDTAVRELHEETGYVLTLDELMNGEKYVFKNSSRRDDICYLWILQAPLNYDPSGFSNDEVLTTQWVPFDEDLYDNVSRRLQQQFPAFIDIICKQLLV